MDEPRKHYQSKGYEDRKIKERDPRIATPIKRGWPERGEHDGGRNNGGGGQ